MTDSLRDAWCRVVEADDYERHMAAIGQAQANAGLVADLFRASPPAPGAEVLFAGAGTGQMFDYVDPAFLAPYRATFTDLNPAYLARLAGRMPGARTVVDDVEATRLPDTFVLVIAVLVLEHVEWRRAVACLCGLSAERVFVVIQKNPPEIPTAVTPARPAIGTMAVFREVHPHLVPRDGLVREFAAHGFALRSAREREVADGKRMTGLEFAVE